MGISFNSGFTRLVIFGQAINFKLRLKKLLYGFINPTLQVKQRIYQQLKSCNSYLKIFKRGDCMD